MRTKGFFVLTVLLAIACKPPTPTEQMDTIISWVSTARMVGDAWLRHTTPDKYTSQTLQQADQMLLQTGSELLKSLPPAIDSAAFDRALTSTRFNISEMSRFVEAKDASRFRQPWDSVLIYMKVMKDYSDKVESSR
ncbi:MAG: hypothetical protein ACJ79Q_13925 [Gemmatimonadaceae bacterium]